MTNDEVLIDLYRNASKRTTKKQSFLIKFIRSHFKLFLELFAATGENAKVVRRVNSNMLCVGIDYNFNICTLSKGNGYIAVTGDCRSLPFKRGIFDMIYSNSFHHVSDSLSRTLQGSVDLLRENGILIGIEPYGSLSRLLTVGINLLPDFVILLLPKGMRAYIKTIKCECKNEGFINWYKRDLKKELTKYNVIFLNRDLFRIYYCIRKA